MLSFKQHSDLLTEKLITFGGKAYPKFGHIVILAGGAGSGKGFISSNLLGIEGKVLDVDELKKMVIASKQMSARIKKETGEDITKFDLKDSKNVSKLHDLLGVQYKVDKKVSSALFRGIMEAPVDRKPNIIFDVTLKDMKKLKTISANAEAMGYDKKNIHIVWVMNEFEIAVDQNAGRDRVVPDDIMLDTHSGAAKTMHDIMSDSVSLSKYMDGDIYIAFNKKKVDSELEVSKHKNASNVLKSKNSDGKVRGTQGQYILNSEYVKVKSVGKASLKPDQLSDKHMNKILSYVPSKEVFEEVE